MCVSGENRVGLELERVFLCHKNPLGLANSQVYFTGKSRVKYYAAGTTTAY